jgi:DNA polymerase
MMVGERPGQEESRRGRPFCGISGKYLDIFLNAAAINRDECYVTNLVKTFTQYGKPTRAEIDADHAELVAEILEHDPMILALVGGWAIEEVLDRRPPEVDKCHGVPVHVDVLFGGELSREGGYVVLPMMHPANAVYSSEAMPALLDDFMTLGKLADAEIRIVTDPYTFDRLDYRIVTERDLDGILL